MKCNLIAEKASRNRLDQLLGYEAGKGPIVWDEIKTEEDVYNHYDGIYSNYLVELKQLSYKGKGLMVDEQKINWLQEAVKEQKKIDALVIWTIEGTKDIYAVSVKQLDKYMKNGTAWIQYLSTDNGYKPVVFIDFEKACYREGI